MSESTPQPDGNGAPTPTPTPPIPVSEPPLPIPSPPALPVSRSENDGMLPRWLGVPTIRDLALFGLGFSILIQQVFFSQSGVDAVLVGLGGTLVGLPIVIRTDKSSK